MDPNQHKYSFQDQNQVSYSNQPSIPTEKQSFGVPQPVDQPYQSSQYVQPDQTIRNRYHSDHQKNQPYSYSSIPEEVSDYIVQDRLGNILLNNDLNRMYGLGKCLCILAILEIFNFGKLAFICYLFMNMYGVVLSLVYMYMPVTFIQGYMKLDANKGKCYLIIKRITNIVGIIIIVLISSMINPSSTQNEESTILGFILLFWCSFNV